MKLINHPALQFSMAALCLGFAGCVSERIVEPLANGYEHVAHPTRASRQQPEATRISLEYRTPDGKSILIWPSLYGVNEVIKGDLVIFVGDRAYHHPGSDDPKGTAPRLFAAKAPGLPLDITNEILWRWSKASGKDFNQTLEQFSLVSPAEKDGQLELHLVFANYDRDWPDTVIQLDWTHVSDIMREVKEKGTVRKDVRWGTPYIEK
jgi:hypothetical protein